MLYFVSVWTKNVKFLHKIYLKNTYVCHAKFYTKYIYFRLWGTSQNKLITPIPPINSFFQIKFLSNYIINKDNLQQTNGFNSLTLVRWYNSITIENLPCVTVSIMKKTLKICNINFEDGFTSLIIRCPFCENQIYKRDTSLASKIYVNKTTGFFVCPHCRHAGKWDALEKMLNLIKNNKPIPPKYLVPLKEETKLEQEAVKSWQQLKKTFKPLTSLAEDDLKIIFNSLKLQTLSPAVAAQFDALVDKSGSTLYFPLHSVEGQLAGYKVLHVVSGQEETVPATNCAGILAPRPGKGPRQQVAVLVPSVADTLALAGQKTAAQVVCLPHGLSHLPQQVLPSLEQYSKLVLWFGNDISSWDTSRNFAKKLDEKRCFLVRPMEKQPSPHVALFHGQDLRAIVSQAQPIWHQAITTFASLREDVLSELQNIEKVVMEAVEHATYVHDISHVIIDNVQFMMGVFEESRQMDRFWKQDAIIASFRTFATKKNCHVTLVIHPRKERDTEDLTSSSIFGSAKASQEADNILIIQDKRLTSLRGKKYLQVAKNRYTGDLGVMALEFDKASLSYGQKKKKPNIDKDTVMEDKTNLG
uniref:SF4 helicase domain-containing protein n=1 Tax=Timema bartmani TaxID=61472 RepID=A0A7R9HY10_9NEOP|nr:unnamed protein product [Timema bartmani]